MSKTERLLTVTRTGQGKIDRLTFNPQKCSLGELEAIIRQKMFSTEGLACTFRVGENLYILSTDYFKEVRKLEPNVRESHILQTIDRVSQASRLIIIPVNLNH